MRVSKFSSASLRQQNKYIFTYMSCLVHLFIRKGYKFLAFNIILKFFFLLKKKFKKKKIEVILLNVFSKYVPIISFLSRKIAANTYQLPWLIREDTAKFLLLRWFFRSVFMRTEQNIVQAMYNEFIDMSNGYGKTVKMVESHYALAIKNRPFMRFLRKRRKVLLSRLKKYGVRKNRRR